MIENVYKRMSIATVLLLMLTSVLYAQDRSISGTVKDAGGNGMPGVNVVAKGTSTGTTTDAEGKYTFSANNNTVMVFSFIGFVTQEIAVGSQTTLDVTMVEDVTSLSEVVVTALGIAREKKALQYSVTDVKGDNFTQARENNVAAQLAGRIAGVNVTKPASGPAGSTRIVIRGNKTIGGQNQPLYVIDGVPMQNNSFGSAGIWGGRDAGDGLTSLNPDDIESITVLKGAAAAALYGSRGGFGVINIVTKRGAARKGLGIDVNTNFVTESIMDLRELQKKYGAGNYVDNTPDGISNGVATKPGSLQQAFDWSDDGWGPKLDGSPVLQFDGVTRPYSYTGNNWKKFYQNGQTWTNSFSLNGGNDKQTFRFSAADLKNKSVLPNAGFDRTNLTLTTTGRYANKLSLNAKIMYSHEKAKNRPNLSDSPGNAPQALWRMPNNIDVLNFKGDPNKLGAIPAGLDPALLLIYAQGGAIPKFAGQEWLPAANNWGQNPYWSTYQIQNGDVRDRINTSTELKYDITSFLYASARASMDWFTRTDDALTPEGTGYDLNGGRSFQQQTSREINLQAMLGFNKRFGEINVDGFVGYNKMRTRWEQISGNGAGFNVQFFPSLNNTKSRTYGYGFAQTGINSVFGQAQVDWKNLVFLTGTVREDWFSVLNPKFKNHVTYPSVGASFVFSDAVSGLPTWMSFGKVRASWAQTGMVASSYGAYASNLTYSLYGFTHLGYSLGSFSSAMGQGGSIPNPGIVPALSTEVEAGVDLRFLNNKIGLDFTYYSQLTTKDIIQQSISTSTGFGSTAVNIGELQNRGVEILLTGTPVSMNGFTWDVSLNVARNKNKVNKLLPGLSSLVPNSFDAEPRTRNALVQQMVGFPFGEITGRVQQKDPNGNPIFDKEGRPVPTTNYVPIGNGLSNWTGGLNNTFSYKGISLGALIDFRFGGDIFSGSNNRLVQWGFSKQSLIGREGETPLHIKGVVNTGTADVPVYTPVDRDLTPHEARNYWNSVGGETTAITSMFLYDASFAKLRQLTLGYSIPGKVLGKTPIKNATVSLVGRNLAILFKNIPNVDPESAYSSQSGAQGLEYFAMPTTRSFGFNVNLGF